jgi:acyl phosphate:glycerol-3-phosphate acyltransferase
MNYLIPILALVVSYLMASFPSGVVIGKVFYKKDVRQFGSGGTGMTNVFRTFGIKAALAVFVLDLSKSILPVLLASLAMRSWTTVGLDDPFLGEVILFLAGLGTTLGHSYPIFAQFKGGKAVSSGGSYMLMTNWIIAITSIVFFVIMIRVKKIVSLSSILGYGLGVLLAVISALIPAISTIGYWNGMEAGWFYPVSLSVIYAILLWRHKENIQRLLSGKELDFKAKKQSKTV